MRFTHPARSLPGPVERAVVDGFAEMCGRNLVALVEVRDRAADAQDFVVGSGGEAHLFHRRLQQRFGVGFQLAELANLRRGHAAVQAERSLAEAALLDLACGDDAGFHHRARRADRLIGQFAERNGWDFDVNVESIQERPADARRVAFDLQRVAMALAARVASITARLPPFSIGLPACSISIPTMNLRRKTKSSNCGEKAILLVKSQSLPDQAHQ